MPELIPGGVELAAIAKHLKSTVVEVRAELARLGVYVGESWNGRPAISEREAYELASGRMRADHEQGQAWRSYAEQAEQWTKARDEVFRQATADAGSVPVGVGPLRARGESLLAAGREAARRYEEQHPPPLWDGETTNLARTRYLEPGLFRRVADRLTGSVA